MLPIFRWHSWKRFRISRVLISCCSIIISCFPDIFPKSLQIRGGISCETGPWSWTPKGCNLPCALIYLSMLYFQGNVFNLQPIGWKAMNTRRQFYKDTTRNMNETLLSLWCLRATCHEYQNGWKREKNTADSGTSALYHVPRYLSVVPWRCTTRFRPAVRLCQLEMVQRCFPIPCPRQDSEGEKSRPLDHMRQIPFVSTSVPPYWLKLRFSHVYIWQCSHFVFHVVRTQR